MGKKDLDKASSEHLYYLDEYGQTCAINIHTGEEVPLETPLAETRISDQYRAIRSKDGSLVYVPKALPLEELKKIQGGYFEKPYSQLLAAEIIKRIAEGELIGKICQDPGMPSYATFCKWRRLYPTLDKDYRQAVQDRAENFLAKALDVVESVGADRDEINLAKLRSDVYKYAAKVGDPDSFSERQNLKADVAVTGYVVETGIRRPGDPGFNIDETKEVGPTSFLEAGDESE